MSDNEISINNKNKDSTEDKKLYKKTIIGFLLSFLIINILAFFRLPISPVEFRPDWPSLDKLSLTPFLIDTAIFLIISFFYKIIKKHIKNVLKISFYFFALLFLSFIFSGRSFGAVGFLFIGYVFAILLMIAMISFLLNKSVSSISEKKINKIIYLLLILSLLFAIANIYNPYSFILEKEKYPEIINKIKNENLALLIRIPQNTYGTLYSSEYYFLDYELKNYLLPECQKKYSFGFRVNKCVLNTSKDISTVITNGERKKYIDYLLIKNPIEMKYVCDLIPKSNTEVVYDIAGVVYDISMDSCNNLVKYGADQCFSNAFVFYNFYSKKPFFNEKYHMDGAKEFISCITNHAQIKNDVMVCDKIKNWRENYLRIYNNGNNIIQNVKPAWNEDIIKNINSETLKSKVNDGYTNCVNSLEKTEYK